MGHGIFIPFFERIYSNSHSVRTVRGSVRSSYFFENMNKIVIGIKYSMLIQVLLTKTEAWYAHSSIINLVSALFFPARDLIVRVVRPAVNTTQWNVSRAKQQPDTIIAGMALAGLVAIAGWYAGISWLQEPVPKNLFPHQIIFLFLGFIFVAESQFPRAWETSHFFCLAHRLWKKIYSLTC